MNNNQKPMKFKIIIGNQHTDHRGTLSFINDFDMAPIKRMYIIKHPDTAIVRAWQGHKIELKYFKCIKGRFIVGVVAIDDWNTPAKNLSPEVFVLDASKTEILYIPNGYANGFKALDNNAQLLVFSNMDLEAAKNDQYKFDENLWMDWTIKTGN